MKRVDRNWWRHGLHEAEELYKLGFCYDGIDDIGGHVFKHPSGCHQTFHFGEEWQYKKGMLDYIEHRKNNPEVFNER